MVSLAKQIVLLNSCHFQQVDGKDAAFMCVRVWGGRKGVKLCNREWANCSSEIKEEGGGIGFCSCLLLCRAKQWPATHAIPADAKSNV